MKNWDIVHFHHKAHGVIFHISFFVLFALACLYVWHTWRTSLLETEASAMQLARTAEAGILQSDLLAIAADADENSPQYRGLKESLLQIVTVNPEIRFAYVLERKDGQIYFLADSEPMDSPDYSPLGQLYHEATPTDFIPFDTRKTIITGPTTDRWGQWKSVLVPTENAREVNMVFGVDYPADSWYDHAGGYGEGRPHDDVHLQYQIHLIL